MNNRSLRSFFISARDLLEQKKIPLCDFHIHTCYADGQASVEQVFEKAMEFGLQAIAFTEHTENRLHSDWFARYYSDIANFRSIHKEKINAYIGIEVPAIGLNGELEMTEEMASRAEFILAAAHRYPDLGGRRVAELNKQETVDMEYRTLIGLAGNRRIDAIAHIGATCSKYCTPFPKELAREVIKLAVKNQIAVEISPVYHKPLLKFIELCAEENALICAGSNAHGVGDIGLITRELAEIFKSDV